MTMQHIKTLRDYCTAINISAPKNNHFDIRRFEENMLTVVPNMPPFRHEFYAIAIKKDGGGHAHTGPHSTASEGYVLFFNSPYQIISWDIHPNWEGYYVLFTQEFVSKSRVFQNLLLEFPFLRMDNSIPFNISEDDMQTILQVFESIYQEHHNTQQDSTSVIQAHVYVLMNYIKRYYDKSTIEKGSQENRNRDLQLISGYQALIEMHLAHEENFDPDFNPHSTTFYATHLGIHPNHLNTIAKRITGQTALKLLHRKLFDYSTSFLLQTRLSIKEIAYSLHFKEAAHFTNFFKKHSGLTPLQFRKNRNITPL